MKKLLIIFLLLSPNIANAKILKDKGAVKNCQLNFDKMPDKAKIDCLQTIMQINVIAQNERIAELELLTDSLGR